MDIHLDGGGSRRWRSHVGVRGSFRFDVRPLHRRLWYAPFGTVTVTQNGANVDITVDLANGPPNTVSWAKTGAADFQEFKFNGTGVALGDITVNQTFAGQTLAPETGAFNGDGTGPFTFGIACTTCANGALGITSDIIFHVANATIADVTAGNSLGNIFVADIFSGQTGDAGPVDVSVPGPLAGAGLPGLVMACGGLIALSRDADVSSSPETPFSIINSLQACWLSPLVSTLVLWARENVARRQRLPRSGMRAHRGRCRCHDAPKLGCGTTCG